MGTVMAEATDQGRGIVGEIGQRIRRGGIARRAGVALIVSNDGEMGVQRTRQAVEHRMIGLAAVQQHERGSAACFMIGGDDTIGFERLHRSLR